MAYRSGIWYENYKNEFEIHVMLLMVWLSGIRLVLRGETQGTQRVPLRSAFISRGRASRCSSIQSIAG